MIKSNERTAATFPAYVNVDNLSNSRSIGVHTKSSGYVSTNLLIENL